MQDRGSRFLVACATGALSETLIEQAVTTSVRRTHQRELHWFSDGWHGYRSILERAYRKRVLTGKRGRPRLVVPESISLMQPVKPWYSNVTLPYSATRPPRWYRACYHGLTTLILK